MTSHPRVLVWGANRHEHHDQRVAELYPQGLHTTIKKGIEENLCDRLGPDDHPGNFSV